MVTEMLAIQLKLFHITIIHATLIHQNNFQLGTPLKPDQRHFNSLLSIFKN